MSPRTPSYRRHKPSGQAVVTLNGRDHYLGKYGSPSSRAEYDRLLSEWLAAGRSSAGPALRDISDISVAEVILAYVRFADGYYVKDGRPTNEAAVIRLALRPLRRLYGDHAARDFGPLALKAVRQTMIDQGLARGTINRQVSRITRMFRWAVENELVSPAVHQALRAVPGLRKGRSAARESPPVRPVSDALVEAIRAHVAPQVWAMVELQRLTGMRPGEVTIMRVGDLDRSGRVWTYTPKSHKTEHQGKRRSIFIGPKAQETLRPWLRADPTEYLFQPAEAMAALWAARRAARKAPMTPSQQARTRKIRPNKTAGDHYDVDSYRRAIQDGSRKAFPYPHLKDVPRSAMTPEQRTELRAWHRLHRWHPHQLRHNAATWLRKEFGLDVARVILGHSSPAVTEVYAELDRETAIAVVGRVG